MSYLSKVAIAGALAVGLTGAASAATLSLEAAGSSPVALSAGFGPTGPGTFVGSTGGLVPTNIVTSYVGADNIGLKVNGVAKLRFTVLGYEAGADNTLVAGAEVLTKVIGNTILSDVIANALADFGFTTTGSPSVPFYNAFSSIAAGGQSVIALFDDGRTGKFEPDYDDLIVRIDVAPVPVPAAGLMLAGALGGLAAMRRRKAKA